MIKKRTLPFVFDSSLPTRFGILPRYAENEDAIRWFEVPAVMMFHVANAWQEGNEVKLFSCCFDQVGTRCCITPQATVESLAGKAVLLPTIACEG